MRDDDSAALAAAANLLLSDYRWPYTLGQPLALTYSFMTVAPSYGLSYGGTNFQLPSEAVKAGVRDALATWAAVARIKFTEVADTGAGGDLRVGMANIDYWAAYAYYPGEGSGGDMIFDPAKSPDAHTFIHEIGHALGLKHPHEAPLLTGMMDSTDYTAMSYIRTGRAVTPMVLDILAVQQLYGANPSHLPGDTVHVFGGAGGVSASDNATVYDTGGRNGFDFSALANPLIDLRAGHFSAFSQTPNFGTISYQVAIAPGTVIHDAVGGHSGSLIYGNDAGNILTGGAGSDVFHPGAGPDAVHGGAGSDTVVYATPRSGAVLARMGDEILIRQGAATDRLTGIETVSFADGDLGTETLAQALETVVEAVGATRLVEVGGWYALKDGTGVGPWLSHEGRLVWAGLFGGALPIAAEAVAGGYRVAFKVTGADSYVAWSVAADGSYVATTTPTVPGTSPALQAMELEFGQDLNGDGALGPKVTEIEALGATRLVQVGDRFQLRDGTGAGPALRYNGAEVVAGQFGAAAPIGAEAVAGGYRVAWKVAGADQFVVWATDASGNHTGNATAVVPGADPALVALEPVLAQDLNGDGRIGLAAVVATVTPLAADRAEGAAGDSTAFTFAVSRGGSTAAGASLGWRVEGHGAAPAQASDFVGAALPSGVVTFLPGQAGAAVTVAVAGDGEAEAHEGFALVLLDDAGGAMPQGTATGMATGLIVNDDGGAAAVADSTSADESFAMGDGADLVRFSAGRAGYRVGVLENRVRVEGPDGKDELVDVEWVKFGDETAVTLETLRGQPGTDELMRFLTTGPGGTQLVFALPLAYAGPLALDYVYPGTELDDVVAGTSRNDFMNLAGGNDAASMGAGDDVVDGGGGNNFLTGGAGRDAFFLDGRFAVPVWSCITDWEVGETLTLWGWTPGVSVGAWAENDGLEGYKGATFFADIDGNGLVETAITWAARSMVELPASGPMQVSGVGVLQFG